MRLQRGGVSRTTLSFHFFLVDAAQQRRTATMVIFWVANSMRGGETIV
jgi:hypothetical protein